MEIDHRQVDELIDYLARIAHAVEVLARAANPEFRPDFTRPRERREESLSGKKSEG